MTWYTGNAFSTYEGCDFSRYNTQFKCVKSTNLEHVLLMLKHAIIPVVRKQVNIGLQCVICVHML